MAETFLFNIADKVSRKVGSLALQEGCLAWGVESEILKLENPISAIRSALLDLEQRQENNPQLTDWVRRIKDVLYDVDDVLEEFSYEAVRSQRGGIKRKVCNVFPSSFTFRLKMGHKIKPIRNNLDKLAAEIAKFPVMERAVDRLAVHEDWEMTHSFVIGRDDDKEYIIKLLLHLGGMEHVSVIPIVGLAGLGKTTLAKLVYDDERVVEHFELRMWVCVSEDFDVTKLTKEIIESAKTGDNCNDLTTDLLQSCLRRTLDNKKFLLILDDVWDNDVNKWIELQSLLIGGSNGSTIIVTTRSGSIASLMGTIPPYYLSGLSHEDCLSLFVKCVFREGEEKLYPNLLKIGAEIVKKCKGVPLAVKTLGRMLYLKTDIRDWSFAKDSEIWELPQNENGILPILKLTFDQLPFPLKQCFAFLSVFPKDYTFSSDELIQLWMAQGFLLLSNENVELEDIGQNYIEVLRRGSLLQDAGGNDNLLQFQIHDLVHDLALSVTRTDEFNVNFHANNVSTKVRHVSSGANDFSTEDVPYLLLELGNLWTIPFPFGGVRPSSQYFVEMCISRYKNLRGLDLRDSCFKVLPSSIGYLKHLRYLSVSGNDSIKKLPNSICKLVNLQTLRLCGCVELDELPRDIGNLISLRSLYITTKQLSFPENGIGRLKSLRTLWIGGCRNLKSLGEGMQHLTMLRTLVIGDCDSLECLPLCIKHLSALETLSIGNCEKLVLAESEEDIHAPRLSLRSLFITRLPLLVALPQWLQGAGNTLQLINIRDCCDLTILPKWLQNLRSLKKLEISSCPRLCTLPEGMDRLTTLGELKIEDCAELSRTCEREIGKKIAHGTKITLLEGASEMIRRRQRLLNKYFVTESMT